ncbi:uncharacterized [Tachysurus ichikawai]
MPPRVPHEGNQGPASQVSPKPSNHFFIHLGLLYQQTPPSPLKSQKEGTTGLSALDRGGGAHLRGVEERPHEKSHCPTGTMDDEGQQIHLADECLSLGHTTLLPLYWSPPALYKLHPPTG